MISFGIGKILPGASAKEPDEVRVLRQRLLQGIERARGNNRLLSRRNAQYEIPWYLVLGQPAAGKTALLSHSGLNFPYAEYDSFGVPQSEGTQSSTWIFSAEAVLLDTPGRYVGDPDSAGEWRGLLGLLREHRPRRPLNGLILAVSILDVIHATVEDLEQQAKRLREKVQEAHALLEVRLPIYLVFTKSDLIPGFTPFHDQVIAEKHGGVLGKTFTHNGYEHADWGQKFALAMAELLSRTQAIGRRKLVQQDIQTTRHDVSAFSFPLELAALAPRLQTFVDCLLRANPYQSSELLRGFYFTVALDQPAIAETSLYEQQLCRRFAMHRSGPQATEPRVEHPLFICGLFSNVIVPDQHLVALYTHNQRERRRKTLWLGAAASTGLLLSSLWSWSYSNNSAMLRQLSGELQDAVTRDSDTHGQYTSWHTWDELRSWSAHYYNAHHQGGVPVGMRFGLYQGYNVEALVRSHYFSHLQTAMLTPTAQNLTRSLYLLPTIKVYRRDAHTRSRVTDIDSIEPRALPDDNSAQSLAHFGEATLRTYLMLSKAQRVNADPAFLKARIPEYWYPAIAVSAGTGASPRMDADYEFASRQITFYSDQIHEPDVPRIVDNAFLASSSRNYINSLLAQSLRSLETITLESDTLFAFGRADLQSLRTEGQRQLSAIAARLLSTPNIGKVVITGHADPLGDTRRNLHISQQRAETVKTFLIGKGVLAGLLDAVGEGSGKPLVKCDTSLARPDLIQCLEPNRRVEIEVRVRN
jgi:type VI secretion system protein ImpL